MEIQPNQPAVETANEDTMQDLPTSSETIYLLPASSGQKRLWFLDQYQPNSSAYNIPSAVRLLGPVQPELLADSLATIIERHETLRTTFALENGEPVQLIHENSLLTAPLPQTDLSHLSNGKRATAVSEAIQTAVFTPFDLENGPLIRTHLLKLAEQEYLLLITLHHIISDGWSVGVLFHELSQLYNAAVTQTEGDLPELPIQYGDFAAWQAEWLESDEVAEMTRYWQKTLGDQLTPLKLPTGELTSAALQHPPTPHQHTLSTDWVHQLQQRCQQTAVTPFIFLMATLQLLLYRLSGEEQIIVGTPVAGRNQTEVEGLIGFFLNSLPISHTFQPDATFNELLAEIKTAVLNAFANQDEPFERLVELLPVSRDTDTHPIFDVMLNYANAATVPLTLHGISAERVELPIPEAKLGLTLYVEEDADQLQLYLLYKRDRFAADWVGTLLDQFVLLLQQLIENPNRPIAAYSLITANQRPFLPDPTQPIPLPTYPFVTEAFAHVVARQPDHPAIRQNGRSWSYRQLHEASQAIAQRLIQAGVQKGETVAISGPKSMGLIASMLGVFASGGVLLSLDPDLPPDRQNVMVTAANAQTLIVLDPHTQTNTWHSGRLLVVDPVTGLPEGNRTSQTAVLPTLTYADPAYLFFTSGTTGTPKGVLGSHKGLAHFLHWQRTTFNIGPQDRSAQLTGLSFDVVLRDIFTPLTGGATLCLPDDEVTLSPTAVLPWMEREQISVLHSVPSLAQIWLTDVPKGITLRSLRLIFSAGEPLTAPFINQWQKTFPQSGQFVNIYGPTETTLAKCYYRVPTPPHPGIQPVGQPMPDTQVLIVNRAGQLCGVNEPGEIVIRTPFASFGYINAPQQQAAHFVPNPFRQDAEDIVYRTGDLGRYRLDGQLDILGRLDHQVKIRGVRIELGEITHAIEALPEVKQTAVLVKEPAPGQKQLVAYLVPYPDVTLDLAAIRKTLRQQLVEAMVPSAFVIMERLPITANGKLDRRALPEPEWVREAERPFVPPRTDSEKQIAAIWQTLLNVPQVGLEDDFFELGGHSLLAVHLFAKIEQQLGHNLPLASLFRDATVRHLAELIDNADEADPWSSLVVIQPDGAQTPFFCVHGMTGDILWFRELGELFAPKRPFYGIQSQGLDGVHQPFNTIPEMAAHYIQAIKQVQPDGPYIVGGASLGGTVALEIAQQLTAAGETVARLVIFDHAPPNVIPLAELQGSPLERVLRIGRNFPRWLGSFIQLGPQAMIDRARRKLMVYRKQQIALKQKGSAIDILEAGDVIDYAHDLPLHRQKLIEANYQAIDQYQPQPWNGRVLLIKAKTRPLVVRSNPTAVWTKLVGPANLTEVYIPGSHEGIFHQPHVNQLAKTLQTELPG